MKQDLAKVRRLARDLRESEPRPAHEALAGLPMAARTLDKCRASLLGLEGDFRFGCPMDEAFFADASVTREAFQELVASGASDAEVAEWLKEQPAARQCR